VVDGHTGGSTFGEEPGVRGPEEAEVEGDRLFLHLVYPCLQLQKVTVPGGSKKPAVRGHDGETVFLLGIAKDSLGGMAKVAEKLLDASMAVAKVAHEINHAVRVGIAEPNPHLGSVTSHVLPLLRGEWFCGQMWHRKKELVNAFAAGMVIIGVVVD
jgi:hypothetical protein